MNLLHTIQVLVVAAKSFGFMPEISWWLIPIPVLVGLFLHVLDWLLLEIEWKIRANTTRKEKR